MMIGSDKLFEYYNIKKEYVNDIKSLKHFIDEEMYEMYEYLDIGDINAIKEILISFEHTINAMYDYNHKSKKYLITHLQNQVYNKLEDEIKLIIKENRVLY